MAQLPANFGSSGRNGPFVAKCPRLMPGETQEDYHALSHLMAEEIEPQSASEWMVTGLLWERKGIEVTDGRNV